MVSPGRTGSGLTSIARLSGGSVAVGLLLAVGVGVMVAVDVIVDVLVAVGVSLGLDVVVGVGVWGGVLEAGGRRLSQDHMRCAECRAVLGDS